MLPKTNLIRFGAQVMGVMSASPNDDADEEKARSNHEQALRTFKQQGYVVIFICTCPSHFFVPQSRERVYYLAVHPEKFCEEHGGPSDTQARIEWCKYGLKKVKAFYDKMNGITTKLHLRDFTRTGGKYFDSSDLLGSGENQLPMDDDDLQSAKHADPDPKRCKLVWHKEHDAMWSKNLHEAWIHPKFNDEVITKLWEWAPTVAALPWRCQDLILYHLKKNESLWVSRCRTETTLNVSFRQVCDSLPNPPQGLL